MDPDSTDHLPAPSPARLDVPAPGEFPPHARGWTLPTHSARWGTIISFPRTRGDGPGTSAKSQVEDPDVSPARAGMDPVSWRGRPIQCFPRTRGDGPFATWGTIALLTPGPVSPARAGMDRNSCRTHGNDVLRLIVRVSPARAGMDRGMEYSGLVHRGEFPPHARGWTQLRESHFHIC